MDRHVRSWIKRLERSAREGLESFELLDGSIYFFDRLETSKELFVHACDLQLGDASEAKWPEPPEVLRKRYVKPATRRQSSSVSSPKTLRAFVDPAALFDTAALVNERRLVPIPYEPPEDLSEP